MSHESAKSLAAKAAHEFINDPAPFIVLDTETTGLSLTVDQACEIAAIDRAGNVLFNKRIRPTVPVTAGAAGVHGMTNEMVQSYQSFYLVDYRLTPLLKKNRVAIYNASYDCAILNNTYRGARLSCPEFSSWCVMECFAQFYGDYSDWHGSYRWQKLSDAAHYCGVEIVDAHTALGDCRMTLGVLKFMASWWERFGK